MHLFLTVFVAILFAVYIYFLQTETSVVIDGIHLNERVKFQVSEVLFVHGEWFVSLSICISALRTDKYS